MVNIENLSDNPSLVLTNHKYYVPKNISNNDISFVLYYSNGCGACRHFHPIYKKYVEKLYKSKDGSLNIKFYEISVDNGNEQTKDAVNTLVKQCKQENQGYIPHLMVFCKNRLLDSHVGGFSSENGTSEIENLHKFIMQCEQKCRSLN
jgi:thiol-disulfide isomerase/thioredoxin